MHRASYQSRGVVGFRAIPSSSIFLIDGISALGRHLIPNGLVRSVSALGARRGWKAVTMFSEDRLVISELGKLAL